MIKYSYLSKTQSRDVGVASDVIKSRIKILVNKKCNSLITEYLLKDKHMKEVLLGIDIIITSCTHEIIR